MYILTHENKSFNTDFIPDENVDLRYCVFDCQNADDTDYYFLPLIFLETYQSSSAVLDIGGYVLQVPLEWSIIVCDEDYTDIEAIKLEELNDRGFCTPLFNPLGHMVTRPSEVNIVNVYAEIKWNYPKLKTGNILVVPVEQGDSPKCALFLPDKCKIPNTLDIAQLFS